MKKTIALLTLLALTGAALHAQRISPAERQNTLESALKLLNERYVFPDMAKQMEAHVRGNARAYETITDGQVLATRLTYDLRAVSHDRHLSVHYHPEGVADHQVYVAQPTEAERAAQRAFMANGLLRENYGILDVAVQKYNTGYLNFKYLAPPEFAGPSYTAALNYLARTDALIIDLRQCGGAISEHAIPFLCSYFFDEPTHLNDFYWREGNRTVQSWTYAQVPGQRYGNKPIYILTSRRTFSGAEELAYDLKNLKRATLVGETTGGGANPGGTTRVNDHFSLFIPFGRAINPITKTNWEGVGVSPDSSVSAIRAMYVAQTMALRALIRNESTDPDWRNVLQSELATLVQNPPRFVCHTFTLAGQPAAKAVYVAGSFNNWSDRATPLVRRGNAWVAEVETEPGKLTYKFVVDGQWMTDPANPRTEGDGQYTNSVADVR